MSQQAFDLRRFIQVVRRHRLLVAGVALVGVILGCAYSYLHPPQLTSTTLVVFPQSVQSSNAAAAAANGGTDTFTATLQVIATSNQVLATAFPGVRPRTTSLTELKHRLTVDTVTTNIISISAHAKVSGDAQATANAVADSYIKYVNASTSPIGRQSASILQPGHQRVGDETAGSADRDRVPRRPGRRADRGHRRAGHQPPGQAAPGPGRDSQLGRDPGARVVPGGPPVGRRGLEPGFCRTTSRAPCTRGGCAPRCAGWA